MTEVLHATPSHNKGDKGDLPRLKLPRCNILRRSEDFRIVRAEGEKKVGRYLVLNYLSRESFKRSSAFIVPKACGNAVMRNRIKRRLREIYRHLQPFLPLTLHSIWIARVKSKEATFQELEIEVKRLYEKAGQIES